MALVFYKVNFAGEFHLWVRRIKPVLRGNANWESISLPSLRRVVTIRQYKFPRGNKEVGETIQEVH